MELRAPAVRAAEKAISAQKRTYFLCAGHRGKGTGAHGYFDEAEEAIYLRDKIAKILTERGCRVVTDDDKADLNTVANNINAKCSADDISVDIHFNAAGSQQANGTEVLMRTKYTTKDKLLAHTLQNVIVNTLATNSRGVKTEEKSQYKSLKMLSGIKCTAVLLEVCFCTNASDASAYQQHSYDLAINIANALMKTL